LAGGGAGRPVIEPDSVGTGAAVRRGEPQSATPSPTSTAKFLVRILLEHEIEQCIARWLERLSDEHWSVIQRRFGLEGQARASLDELAKDLHLTGEQVRRIQVEALEGLVLALRQLGWHGRASLAAGKTGERGRVVLECQPIEIDHHDRAIRQSEVEDKEEAS
jgi:hypothetical protein